MLTSMVCRYEHFETSWYEKWARQLGFFDPTFSRVLSYRKIWEWCGITQVLAERGMLAQGRRGCGFAVGKEPLVSLFASLGADVTATDRAHEHSEARWIETDNHARSAADLYQQEFLDEAAFARRVKFQPADMHSLEGVPAGQFDFVWSSCALEHLGTLSAGAEFVVQAMTLLKSGGVAVHTTEYNVSSNDDTVSAGLDVIYRRRDLEDLARRLRQDLCEVAPFDYDAGKRPYDLDYDVPPYFETGRKHIKLLNQGYVITSCLVIIRKG